MGHDAHLRTGRVRASLVLLALSCIAVGVFVGLRWRAHGSGPGAASRGAATEEATTLWTCSMHPQVIQDHPGLCPICHMQLTPLRASSGDGALAIDPVVVQSMGVRTVRLARGAVGRHLRAYGTLQERTPDHRDVTLRVSGWIETIATNMDGMQVAKGDPLFTLSSPELTVAIEELIAARKQQVGDEAGAHSFGEVLYASARQKLVLLGLDAGAVDRLALADAAPATVTFASPVDGHVVELAAQAGSTVKAGDRILTVADNRTLWLDLRIAAADVGGVTHGSTLRARVDGFPNETFDGVVSFIHPHADMQSRTALVRAEIANPDRRLREGQWAVADLELAIAPDALCVPREAVIETGVRAVAFVALGGGRFEPREVVLGASADGGMIEVQSGLAEGEEVVVSGQFLLDSESRLREAIQKFRSPGSEPPVESSAPRPEWADGVDELVERYLVLSDALGKPQESDTPLDAQAFVAAARDLARRAGTDARVSAVVDSAVPLLGAKLIEQREAFKKTSEALLALVARVPPSEKFGGTGLFVMNCPMAPGRWLQRDPAVKNPYYGTTMKECGEVLRPLALVKEHKQ